MGYLLLPSRMWTFPDKSRYFIDSRFAWSHTSRSSVLEDFPWDGPDCGSNALTL